MDRRLCRRARVFLYEVCGEKLRERGNTGRLARYAGGQQLSARQTDRPEDFIAPEKIDDLDAVCSAGVARFERGQKRIEREMEGKIVEFLTGGRLKAYFV